MRHISIVGLLIFLATSCSTIKVFNRREKDISLNSINSQKLNGKYSNRSLDKSLWQAFDDKMTSNKDLENATIQIQAVNKTQLSISLLLNDRLINQIKLKGAYKNGYFSIEGHLYASFKYGPIWTLDMTKMYIGLSNENDLVLLTQYSTNAFVVLMPVGGAEDHDVTYFHRID